MTGYLVPPTKNPGDVLTSALWNTYIRDNLDFGMVRPIADVALGVAAASFDFTSIPQTFRHLLLVKHLRGDTAAVNVNARYRANNDSTAVYYYEQFVAAGTSPTAAEGIGISSGLCGDAPAGTSPANNFGATLMLIPNYTTAHAHGWIAMSSHMRAQSTGQVVVELMGGEYYVGAAINRVTIFPSAGNWDVGSRAILYGMGGI